MSNIELAAATKEEIVAKLQLYFTEELQLEIGSFDAQFLLDFFSEQVGNYYYNQGLADALKALENKIEEFSDTVYQLEKDTNPAKK
ncbi:MAG: DUF2164 domain-containing protein [Proteobacteria bacterium]|nr:DUF2164 domain-containing protein [Pseudomonadota bacterium]